ncbi:MAG: YkgJ family cysteine cluster protein [Saprospirales bacterium]|nr:MAG: YkgJ family cysteine cluster protein [Saprospirales bacterium]
MENLKQLAKRKKKTFSKLLKKGNRSQMIRQLPELHEQAFSEIDCLDCAACCKNFSPTFKPTDIKRISKYIGMKEGDFIDEYLQIDEDNDYVVKTKPCPFLQVDNSCGVYEVRPTDCARFPYTDSDVFVDKSGLSLKNSTFCPAAFKVLELLNENVQR